jgi:hypothetical protein
MPIIGLLGVGVATLGVRRRRIVWGGLALGVVVFPIVVIVAGGLMTVGWWALTNLNPNARVFF